MKSATIHPEYSVLSKETLSFLRTYFEGSLKSSDEIEWVSIQFIQEILTAEWTDRSTGEVLKASLEWKADSLLFQCQCEEMYTPCSHIRALLESKHSTSIKEKLINLRDVIEERRDKYREQMPIAAQWVLQQLQLLLKEGIVRRIVPNPNLYFKSLARSLADIQWMGLSRYLEKLHFSSDENKCIQEIWSVLGRIYFIAKLSQNTSSGEPIEEDLLYALGFTYKKQDIQNLGVQIKCSSGYFFGGYIQKESDGLKRRKRYFYSFNTNGWVFTQDFIFGNASFEPSETTLGACSFTFGYYPSAYPLRAIVYSANELVENSQFPFNCLEEERKRYGEALQMNPLLDAFPWALKSVSVLQKEGEVLLISEEGFLIPLSNVFKNTDTLLSLSVGMPIDLFGEWDGEALFPILAVEEGRITPLHIYDSF